MYASFILSQIVPEDGILHHVAAISTASANVPGHEGATGSLLEDTENKRNKQDVGPLGSREVIMSPISQRYSVTF